VYLAFEDRRFGRFLVLCAAPLRTRDAGRDKLGEGERVVQLQVDEAGRRLDRYLVRALPDMSRSQVQRLIRQGLVALDGEVAKPSTPVEPGMRVVVRIPFTPSDEITAQTIPIDAVYEDEDLLVVNKPAGMVVHPAHGHWEGTLVNALLARYPDLAVGDAGRPGIVHRLDRDTSGLIVVAKTEAALEHLRQQFKSRAVKKTYLALVHGQPPAPEGIVEAPVGRDPHRRQRMAVVPGGRAARTHYRLLESLGHYCLLAVSPETGRTHQIRVHLSWLGVPVVGDPLYNRGREAREAKKRLGLARQFLHAWRLCLERPGGKGVLELEAPLPTDLARVLRALRGVGTRVRNYHTNIRKNQK
jgi:23S rRNA pseudouridine1911/1915/1917 synthase